ncbi:MAG: hypothetical protein RBS72_11790 [Sedimentisphaerales bacterium]|nr:hypothetical protein [Sedimentisphaerales bacterium]HNY80509.1 hypothetical protein [Sedimentisphaerales bacterium]HOC63717.1 hypothetical protein [Sedimentisphaerales bacterium]HOH66276.1 hypothetical protein [Sedimentisphaerales bacterium]HPY50404.1 hypothetical protein [Sedimentisphaerales bacterium]
MNRSDKTLRERLLNMETLSSTPGELPREQVRRMLDARLTVAKRIGFGFLAFVGACTAIAFAGPAGRDGGSNWEQTFIYRMVMIFAFLVCVAWTLLTGWVAASGVVRRAQRPWIAVTSLAMGFFYLITLVFVVPISRLESRAMLATQMALIGFFLFNTIGLCAILGVLYRGQFKSQEKLLEIEYRIADLAEKIGDPSRP